MYATQIWETPRSVEYNAQAAPAPTARVQLQAPSETDPVPTGSREAATMATPSLIDKQLQRGIVKEKWTNRGWSVSASCDEPGKDLRRKPKDVEKRDSEMKGCQTLMSSPVL